MGIPFRRHPKVRDSLVIRAFLKNATRTPLISTKQKALKRNGFEAFCFSVIPGNTCFRRNTGGMGKTAFLKWVQMHTYVPESLSADVA